ncbi:MAG: FtsX-like permease family protein, partial [Candidatus Kariarchaeaceae archaeon]
MSAERKPEISKDDKKALILFLLSINSFLIFLLTDTADFISISYIFSGLTVLFILYGFIKKRKLSIGVSRSIISLNLLRLTKKYLFINRKYIFASILGLVLATFILSQSILVSTSYEQEIFNREIAPSDNIALEVDLIGLPNLNIFNDWDALLRNELGTIIDDFDFDMESFVSDAFITLNVQSKGRETLLGGQQRFDSFEVQSNTWNYNAYYQLQQLPTFNYTEKYFILDKILIVPADQVRNINLINPWNNNTVRILSDDTQKSPVDQTPFRTFNLQFDYIWSASELDTAYIQDNGIDLDFDISKGQIFVNLLDKWNLVDLLYANARSGWSSNKLITGETKVQINIPQLSEIDLPQFRDNLIKLQLDVQNWIYDQIDLANIEINSPLYNSILSYMETAETIQLRLMLVSGPLAGMALFLVYFSLALVEQRKIKLVQVMKIRGTSEDQLRIMFYGEILVSSIIAVVIGMLLSIPWAKLSLRTSDYFEFNASEIPLSIPAVWYWRLPLIGLILALDLHIYSITSLSKLRIDADQDRKVDAREPIWSKIYLDLIIFILSTLFWLVMHFYSFENEDEFSNLLDLGGVVALVA